jgi:hypothetical protein
VISGPTPDITPAQIAALLGWIVAQAVAFGWIKPLDAQLAVSLGATVIASVLKLADSYLRGQRAKAHAIAASPAPPPPAA